ncbi:hypothetical protein [Lysinibacter sp. HNR]|uniref:hypothetical protein n=1 Tax=Lysinibacter sp. HNR TaxID=3031408 RepID=UPI0024353D42|nr:hypothetical protein [Lysinibacter sp. HNR]WGD36253.1 hypothetical protein FrondiHNR_07090 [Lysinibacter sp. HNR]
MPIFAKTATRLGVALSTVVLAISVTACTAQTNSDDALNTGTSDADYDAWYARYSQCMKEQGIDIDGGNSASGDSSSIGADLSTKLDDGSPSASEMEAANRKCINLVGNAPVQEGFVHSTPEETQEEALKQARCLREKGHDVPDPVFDGGMTRFTMEDSIPEADIQACSQ